MEESQASFLQHRFIVSAAFNIIALSYSLPEDRNSQPQYRQISEERNQSNDMHTDRQLMQASEELYKILINSHDRMKLEVVSWWITPNIG